MEIILVKDVDNLGLAGQVMKVANGYARNYLLPQNLALPATAPNLKVLAKKRTEFESRARQVKDQAVALKAQVSAVQLVLVRKAGDKGKLYGAVTPQDVVEAAQAKGLVVDRKRLRLAEPIKTLGDFEAILKLHPEVQAPIKIRVVAEGSPQDPAVAEAAAAAEAAKVEAEAQAAKAENEAQAAMAEAEALQRASSEPRP
jgi:large subunit ribosomal protein L9